MNILDYKRKALGYTFRGESDSTDYTPAPAPAATPIVDPRAKIATSLGVPISSVVPLYGTMMGGRDDNTLVEDTSNITGYAVKQNDSLGVKFDATGNQSGTYVPQTAQDPFTQIGNSLGDVAKIALVGAAVYFGVPAVANLISSIGAAAAAEVVGATGITAGTAATIAPEVLAAAAAELTTATAGAGLAAGELGLAGGTALGAGNLGVAGALGGTAAGVSGLTFSGLLSNPGGTLGKALGITDPTLAKLAGNTIIETARNGGDVEGAIKNTAISYGLNLAGSTVSTAVKDALKDIPQSELSDSVKAGITRGVTGAAVATLQGRDPMQALVGSASSTALNELVKQIPGYSDNTLSPEAKRIANNAVKAALTGKDITSTTLNAALNEGIRAAADYADTTLGLKPTANTSSVNTQAIDAANPMSQDPAQRAASTTPTVANTTTGSTTLDDIESTLAANGLQNTGGTGFDAVNQLAGNAGNLTTDLSAGDVATITGNTGDTTAQQGVVTAGNPTGTVTDAGPQGGNPLQNLRAGETAGATQKIENGYEVTEVYGTTADGKPYSYAVTYNPNARNGNNYEYTWFTPLTSGGYQLNTSGSLPNFDSQATGSGVDTSADTSSNNLTDDQIEEIITGGQTNLGDTTSQEILDALNDATIPGSTGADTSSSNLTDEQIQEIITGGQTNLGDTTSQEILDALNDADTNDTTQSGGVFTTGIKGDRGERGLTGAAGAIGAQGERGEQGLMGLTGATGATGERGEQGLMGLTGATGEQGIAGERGETGERGERGEAGTSQSPEEIRAIVDAALAANPNLTEAQVTTAINAAIANIPAGISTADVSNAINTAIANIPAGISSADVTSIVTDATKDLATRTDVNNAIANIQFPAGISRADVAEQITTALAANPNLTANDVAQSISDYMTANPGITAAEVGDIVSNATRDLATTGSVETVKADLTRAINDANSNNASAFDAIDQAIADLKAAGLTEQQVQTIVDTSAGNVTQAFRDALNAAVTGNNTALDALQTTLSESIAATETKLTDAIAANEAAGLTRDQATQKAIDDVADQLGTTKADLLVQLGTTEAALTTKLTTGLAEVETKLTETEQRLSDAIQAAKDIGLEGDAALQAGLDSVAAELGVAKTELLTQLGKTENDLRNEFQTGLGGVTTDIAKTRTDLTEAIAANEAAGLTRDQATQKAIDDIAGQLGTTKVDLLAQLGTTEQALASQISGVKTDLETQLTEQGRLFRDSLIQQGMDQTTALQTAIDAQNQLITEGQTATQTALAALSTAQQQEVADRVAAGETTAAAIAAVQLAVDTGQAATQAALNALSTAQQQEVADRVAAGETTNAAIAAVQAAVTEGQTDTNKRIDDLMAQGLTQYEATQQAILELSTGFTDQLTAAELARQTDRDAAEAARQADITAAAEQRVADQTAASEAAAAAEKARQTEITNQKAREAANLKTIQTGQLRGQMQSGLQGLIGGLQQQATQMAAPAQVETVKATPGFDFGSPLNVGFFGGYESQKTPPKDKESLKIATGGYLDDLLEAIR